MLCGFQTVAKSFFLCYNRFKRRCGRSNVSFCLEREPPSVKERQGKGRECRPRSPYGGWRRYTLSRADRFVRI